MEPQVPQGGREAKPSNKLSSDHHTDKSVVDVKKRVVSFVGTEFYLFAMLWNDLGAWQTLYSVQ